MKVRNSINSVNKCSAHVHNPYKLTSLDDQEGRLLVRVRKPSGKSSLTSPTRIPGQKFV